MATQAIKDILDANISKPSFSLQPGGPLPQEYGAGFARESADDRPWYFKPEESLYVKAGSGKPVVTGGVLKLREGAACTVPASGRPNTAQEADWGYVDTASGGVTSGANTIFKGEGNIARYNGGIVRNTACRIWRTGDHSLSFIFEARSTDKIGLYARNEDAGIRIGGVKFSIPGPDRNPRSPIRGATTNNVTTSGEAYDGMVREVTSNGPNGYRVFRVVCNIAADSNADTASGDNAGLEIQIDESGGTKAAYLHHVQKCDNSQVPQHVIYTPSTSNLEHTVGAERFTLYNHALSGVTRPDWLSDSEGTWYWEIGFPGLQIDQRKRLGLGLAVNARSGFYYRSQDPNISSAPRAYDGSSLRYTEKTRNATEGINKIALTGRDDRYLLGQNGVFDNASGTGDLIETKRVKLNYGNFHDVRFFPTGLDKQQLKIITS